MSERQNRIAALLNSSSASTAAPAATTTDDSAPGTVTYDIPAGKSATDAQLGIDSSPDALISVDGHKVAAGDNGLSIDIAPDGSTHVTHGPQDPAQPTAQPTAGQYGQYGQVPTTVPPQYGQGQDGTRSSGDGSPLTGQDGGYGAGGQDGRYGTTQNGAQPQDGTTGRPVSADGSTSPYDVPDQDRTQVEHLQGIGDHGAKIDLALHGPKSGLPAPVIHERADGSQDITIPKGPDNPHAVTVHVQPNKDGSFDLTVPKSHTNPHEIKIHVEPDKHVDLNITQDKNGHLKIDAHDHPKDQQGDWPGLQGPAGQHPGHAGEDPNQPGQPGRPGQPGGPGDGGDLPQVPKMPDPQKPEMPKTQTPDAGGGGGGMPKTGGGGGGMPKTGGGGGDIPDPGKNDPPKTKQPPQTQPPPVNDTGFATIKQDSIKALGKDIDAGPVHTMDQAHKDASGVNIGYPGLGVAGAVGGLASAHTEVRDTGAKQFADGHTALSKWVPNLNATAANWQGAEDDSNNQVNSVPQ
jgi:hypothetical protein